MKFYVLTLTKEIPRYDYDLEDWISDYEDICAGVISYLEQYNVMDKNTICIFEISDTNERKVKYVYNNVLRELREAFYGEVKFICIPSLIDKYSEEFNAGEEG